MREYEVDDVVTNQLKVALLLSDPGVDIRTRTATDWVTFTAKPVCCDRIYYCPSSNEVQCRAHGGPEGRGFLNCCARADCPGNVTQIDPGVVAGALDDILVGLSGLHQPFGVYCEQCDADRDVDIDGSNPECVHQSRCCRTCSDRAQALLPWPCPTAILVNNAQHRLGWPYDAPLPPPQP